MPSKKAASASTVDQIANETVNSQMEDTTMTEITLAADTQTIDLNAIVSQIRGAGAGTAEIEALETRVEELTAAADLAAAGDDLAAAEQAQAALEAAQEELSGLKAKYANEKGRALNAQIVGGLVDYLVAIAQAESASDVDPEEFKRQQQADMIANRRTLVMARRHADDVELAFFTGEQIDLDGELVVPSEDLVSQLKAEVKRIEAREKEILNRQPGRVDAVAPPESLLQALSEAGLLGSLKKAKSGEAGATTTRRGGTRQSDGLRVRVERTDKNGKTSIAYVGPFATLTTPQNRANQAAGGKGAVGTVKPQHRLFTVTNPLDQTEDAIGADGRPIQAVATDDKACPIEEGLRLQREHFGRNVQDLTDGEVITMGGGATAVVKRA